VIAACQKSASKPSTPRWAAPELLRKHQLELPIWAPYEGETKGFHTVSNARAVEAGLKFRPIETIVADTLAWFRAQSAERQAKLFERNLKPEKEAEVIAALA
jgi:2'-hydroxyisoflavone reductase